MQVLCKSWYNLLSAFTKQKNPICFQYMSYTSSVCHRINIATKKRRMVEDRNYNTKERLKLICGSMLVSWSHDRIIYVPKDLDSTTLLSLMPAAHVV